MLLISTQGGIMNKLAVAENTKSNSGKEINHKYNFINIEYQIIEEKVKLQ